MRLPFARAIVAGVATLVLAACLAAPARAQPLSPPLGPGERIPRGELEAFIDGVVLTAMAEHRLVGVTVSVVQGGEVVLAKGYGFADLESGRRVDPDATLFRVGSITKTFTWIAIMRLVEAGLISLDDPINDHLPAELRIPDQGFDAPIRVRDLMTHQPGFEDRALGVLFERDPREIRPLGRFLRETRPNRVRPPGELSSYSNYGTALAGAIVEHLTGRPWQDVIDADILQPLGMRHTTGREPYPARDDLPAPMPEALAASLARGYRIVGASPVPQPFEHVTQLAPAGAMSSTAADMARYLSMLLGDGELDGVRIFGAVAARAFRTPMTSLPSFVGGWDGGFAEVPAPGGFRSYGHDGATLTFFSSLYVLPELDLGLFVSTNTAGGAVLTGTLLQRVVQNFYAPPSAPLEGRPELRGELAVYAGQYRITRRRYEALEGFVMRLQGLSAAVSPNGYLTVMLSRPTRFVPADEPGHFQNADGPERVVIERRNGRPTVILPAAAAEQLGPLESPATLMTLLALAALAAVGSAVGLMMRLKRPLPATASQTVAGRLQVGASILWLASFAAFAVFAAGAAANPNAIAFNWPTPSILAFSSLALLASLVTVSLVALLPAVWRGTGGWSRWRKARFTAVALVFAACAAMLLSWGALQPWNP